MELILPIQDGLALTITEQPTDGPPGSALYPSGRLAKGLSLRLRDEDLTEEGVGFGVPILKRGPHAVFPGSLTLAWRRLDSTVAIEAVFTMSLVERLSRTKGGQPTWRSADQARETLAALHRRVPRLRAPLTAASNALRRQLGWVTTFEEGDALGTVRVSYTVRDGEGRVGVAVDPAGLTGAGVTELVVMNELGARQFDRYCDAAGTSLEGAEIGTWDEVAASRAAFSAAGHNIVFALAPIAGARLFRGRELVGSRLAWAGFGYSLTPPAALRYELRVGRGAAATGGTT